MIFRHTTRRFDKGMLCIIAAVVGLQAIVAEAQIWPKHYNAPAASWVEGSYAGGFAYHSKSYAILSSEKIAAGRINEMATVAESVRGVLRQFPLELLPDRRSEEAEPRRDVIRLFSTHRSYLEAGGPGGSSGFYNAHSREVIVSLEYLIERKGHRSNLEPRQRYRLLVHELVHQAMAENAVLLPLWLSEGIAEYLSAAQFAPGRYRFNEIHRDTINHMRTVWLHDRRNAITIPTVESLVKLDTRAWTTDNRKNKKNAYAKYAASLLLTHYFMELASRDRGGLREFLTDSKEKTDAARSHRTRRRYGRRPAFDQTPLWKDRPPAMVQQQLKTFWNDKGLKLTFTPLRPLERKAEDKPGGGEVPFSEWR